jgi:ABC-type Mn2+/Zn2+ transport system ATPase subunit
MKIKKAKWSNHSVLGDLELDFMAPDTGQPYDTIILAGENGSGKTTILDTLSKFLNKGNLKEFEYIEYITTNEVLKALPAGNDIGYKLQKSDGSIEHLRTNSNTNSHLIENNPNDIRYYGCIFSKAQADTKQTQ